MRGFFVSPRVSFALTLVVFILHFTNSPLVKAGEPEWVEVRSPNFCVITDAGEKRGRDVAMRFEQMRAVFGTLMSNAKVTLPVPLQIVAFRNTKEMRQVAPIFHGKPTQVAGLFQSGGDRSFIIGLREGGEDVAIVRAIIDLGRHLGLDVVAEGVEDEATSELLTEMGCDIVQGWHIARPMPTGELLPWLRAHAPAGSSRLRVV